jgi:nicotinamidase-related amidase
MIRHVMVASFALPPPLCESRGGQTREVFMLTGKAALIVNEMQLGVIDARFTTFPQLAQQVAARGIVPNIAGLIAAFRKAGLPVVHTPVVHREDLQDVKANSLISNLSLKKRSMREGTEEVAYVAGLEPVASDLEIRRTSGLISICATQLDAMLRRMDVETLVIVGVSTNLGVAGNAIVGCELGYHIVIPEDCIAGSDPQVHETILNNQLRMIARISTAADVIAALPAA